jgi:hypothetical protein
MVLRKQFIDGVESERVSLMDSWQTYVSPTLNERFCTNNLLILKRGREKARFCMHHSMGIFELIHNAF